MELKFTEEKMLIKDDHISKEAVCSEVSVWINQFMSNTEEHHHVHHLSFSNLRLFPAHTAKHGSPGHHTALPPCGDPDCWLTFRVDGFLPSRRGSNVSGSFTFSKDISTSYQTVLWFTYYLFLTSRRRHRCPGIVS